jgi:hypothetical protein
VSNANSNSSHCTTKLIPASFTRANSNSSAARVAEQISTTTVATNAQVVVRGADLRNTLPES